MTGRSRQRRQPRDPWPQRARALVLLDGAQRGVPWADAALPLAPPDDLALKLCRSAALGISAACVSDTISNSLRVLKTTRQTSAETLSYREAARSISVAYDPVFNQTVLKWEFDL